MAYLTGARRNLASLLTRTLSSPSPLVFSSSSSFSGALFSLSLLVIEHSSLPFTDPFKASSRFKSSGPGYSPLNDPSPNWSNRPPKETILLDGCDYEHWLIVMEFPEDPKPTEEQMIDSYVKTLASVLGSEEEAKKKMYSVSTRTYTGFGALISEELSYKVKELPNVLWVLPDSYLDVPNKDYGGDLFVDGKVIHRPQFWYQNRPQSGRARPRPRHDRRREMMQVERRETMQGHSRGPDQRQPVQQPPAMNSAQGEGGGSFGGQGQFN